MLISNVITISLKIASHRVAQCALGLSVGLQVDIHPVHGYKECLEYQLFRSEYQKLSASASRSHQLIVKLDTSLFMVTKCALNVQFSGRNIKKFQLALRARNYCLKHTACSLYIKKKKQGWTVQFSSRNIKLFQLALRARINYFLKLDIIHESLQAIFNP